MSAFQACFIQAVLHLQSGTDGINIEKHKTATRIQPGTGDIS